MYIGMYAEADLSVYFEVGCSSSALLWSFLMETSPWPLGDGSVRTELEGLLEMVIFLKGC